MRWHRLMAEIIRRSSQLSSGSRVGSHEFADWAMGHRPEAKAPYSSVPMLPGLKFGPISDANANPNTRCRRFRRNGERRRGLMSHKQWRVQRRGDGVSEACPRGEPLAFLLAVMPGLKSGPISEAAATAKTSLARSRVTGRCVGHRRDSCGCEGRLRRIF